MKKGKNLLVILLLIISLIFIKTDFVNALTTDEPTIDETVVQEVIPIETQESNDVEVIDENNENSITKTMANVEDTIITEPEAGEVVAEKNAEVVEGLNEDGRSADVTIKVDGTSFTTYTQEEREIVLVLDDSGSMDYAISDKDKTVRLEALKEAAEGLIDSLFAPENKGKVKVGIVYYGSHVTGTCALTTNKDELMICLDAMDGFGGTNVQAGLRDAKTLFTDSTTSLKDIILLSDGEPTYYEDEPEDGETEGVLHGTGKTDEHEDSHDYETEETVINGVRARIRTYYDKDETTVLYTCTSIWVSSRFGGYWENQGCSENQGKKPSEAAIEEIEDFKNPESDLHGVVHTVGFAIEENSAAEKFLQEVASVDSTTKKSKYYLAKSLSDLIEILKAIENDINLIATNVKVVDVIPNTFTIDENYFETNFQVAEIENDGTTKYGDNVIVKTNDDGSTTLTWLIGDLKTTSANKLTFRIIAKEDYYGNMFTNNGATVTGIATDGNPFYVESNAIEIDLIDPTVAIPAVTKNDSYVVNQGETLTITKENGVRKNDYASIQKDNNATVVDEVVKVLNVNKGSLTLNKDGSFNFLAPIDYYGDVTFTYFIETTVKVEGKEYVVKSNTSTATITINRIEVPYVIHHYLENTTKSVANDEKGNGYVYEKITGNAKTDLLNYVLVANTNPSQTITLEKNNNVVTFYYQLKDGGKVTVYYYEEGTTNSLAEVEYLSGKTTENYESVIKNIENWELVEVPENAKGQFTLEKQEVIYYYKKLMGKVVAKYVDENGKPLRDFIETIGQVGTNYETKSQAFTNYKLIKVEGIEKGLYDKESIEVTYIYKYVGNIIDTGISSNKFPEMFFMIMSVVLTGTIIFKKRYN